MERFPVSGVHVYTLDVCGAVGDHEKCPGMGTLRVDHLELGTVMCDCACHKRPDAEVIAFPTTGDR